MVKLSKCQAAPEVWLKNSSSNLSSVGKENIHMKEKLKTLLTFLWKKHDDLSLCQTHGDEIYIDLLSETANKHISQNVSVLLISYSILTIEMMNVSSFSSVFFYVTCNFKGMLTLHLINCEYLQAQCDSILFRNIMNPRQVSNMSCKKLSSHTQWAEHCTSGT